MPGAATEDPAGAGVRAQLSVGRFFGGGQGGCYPAVRASL